MVVRAVRPSTYRAFISYSHAVDERLAPALQRALHTFAKPWYRLRAIRVFRDEGSLSADPELWGSIQRALDGSDFFILLASPASARSEWVQREVAHRAATSGSANFLIVLTAGDIDWDDQGGDFDWSRTTALPPTIAGVFKDEPRFIDFRWASSSDELTLRDPRFLDAVAELAAPLRGRDKDDLVGDDVRQHRRTVRLAGAAIASLVVLTLASVVGAAVALDQRNTARDQAALATSRQLAATAQTQEGSRLDRALLLSMEAVRIRDTPEARGALLRALHGSRRLHQTTQFEGALHAVAVSPDGHTLATGGADMEVHLRDLLQRRPAGDPRRSHTGRVESVAFSPDGRTLASSSADGTIAVWDVESGRPIGDPLAAHAGGVERVTFSPDGSALASAGADGKVAIWDVATRSPRAVLEGHTTGVRSVGFSPDGRWLVSADFDGKVVVWDPARHQPVAEVRHDHAVTALAFAPDGALFASASIDGAVKIWALPHAAESGTALMVANGTTSISFSADGNVLAAGTYRGRITLWDVQRRQPLGELGGAHEARVNELAFSPNSPGELASVAEDGTFALWDTDLAQGFGTSLRGDRAWVTSVAFHPDGTRLAAAMATGTSAVWALPEHRVVATLDGHDGAVTSVAFSPDGRLLASAGADGDVRLWDVDAGRMVREPLRRPGAHLTSVAFSPDGRLLAAAGTDGTVVLWDPVGGVPVQTLTGHAGEVTSVAFRPDGRHLASGSADQTIRIWETSSGRPLRELRGHGDARVLAVAFSPDGKLLASGGADRGVVLWDPVRAERRQSFNGHAAEVGSVAFSPDGRLLASGGDDHNVVLWDLRSGRALSEGLRGHTDPVRSLAFDPRGITLASGSLDYTVMLWTVSLEAWERQACALVARDLTEAEWRQFVGTSPKYHRTCSGSHRA